MKSFPVSSLSGPELELELELELEDEFEVEAAAAVLALLGVAKLLATGRNDEMLAARGVIGSSTLMGSMCHSPYEVSRLHVHADSSAVVASQVSHGGSACTHAHVFGVASGGSHDV